MKFPLGGSRQGKLHDLENPTNIPEWVDALKQEIRALGDLIRLREALAVTNRDIERFRTERDWLLKLLKQEQDQVKQLESIIQRTLRGKDGKI